MAAEARDTIELGPDTQQITLSDDPFAQMALARTNLMAGTLQSTLDLGLQFAQNVNNLAARLASSKRFSTVWRWLRQKSRRPNARRMPGSMR